MIALKLHLLFGFPANSSQIMEVLKESKHD